MAEENTPEAIDVVETLQEFLATVPPGSERMVNVWQYHPVKNDARHFYHLERTKLYCPDPHCERVQLFGPYARNEAPFVQQSDNRYFYLVCNNCKHYAKLYAVTLGAREDGAPLRIRKHGEFPAFGPPTPARLMRLIQDERELFLKGMRAESQSMGIAAYAYYRRVIESQKDRIFDGFIAVAKHIGASAEQISDLEAAKKETQFEKAVAQIKHGVPDVLKIEGQNPLLMLHSTLSGGLHALSDAECLSLANDIRNVMIEMAERLNTAMSDNAELRESVKKILARQATRGRKPTS